ncbi:MAG: N-acetylmuramoyl-L-alanine amidase [Pseudomonadota bacterium]|nr:N-acetylmuramoyl-L-alanine amidase [Sphingomonas sp.]MDQ3478218.1 N-acetylmuramoyl-L-alanine amidase [Pseudomonadota bacterium]
MLALAALVVLGGVAASAPGDDSGLKNSATVALAAAIPAVAVTKARLPGRPIVLIDAGHGGSDPGAPSVSGEIVEKQLTLQLARELRDRLADNGRVRVALTRSDDSYLTLAQRSLLARRLGASLYVSLHMDSAPNPLARGASVYSLSEVASDAEAARLAETINAGSDLDQGADGSVRAILSDLALRSQMTASAQFAERLVRNAQGRVPLRPDPHRFADFHVLRGAGVPAVLFEAGYISNVDDEVALRSHQHRSRIVAALARAIEADASARAGR